MIRYKGLPLVQLQLNLLCDYTSKKSNNAMAKLAQLALENKIQDPTIRSGVISKLKDINLNNDEEFLKTGNYLSLDRDLVNLNLIALDNDLYVIDYSILQKTSDQTYLGEDATGFANHLNNYVKFDNQGKIELRIDKIHEMGYFNMQSPTTAEATYDKGITSISFGEHNISSDKNFIVKKAKDTLLEQVRKNLPKHITLKGEKLYFTSFDSAIINYFNKGFQKTEGLDIISPNLEILSEIVYFENASLLTQSIVQYLISRLHQEILTSIEIKNIIDRFAILDSCKPVVQSTSEATILLVLEKEVEKDPLAKKNMFFAKDLIECESLYSLSRINMINKTGKIEKLIHDMFHLNEQSKSVTFISKYILTFSLEKPISELNDGETRKRMVFDALVSLSKKLGFQIRIVTPGNHQHDHIQFVKNDLKEIHGRYIFVEGNINQIYKIDAELDHFVFLGDDGIRFKDLSIMLLDSQSQIPNSLRVYGGESNV